MKQKGIRIALVVIELFVGLWAVIGGVGLAICNKVEQLINRPVDDDRLMSLRHFGQRMPEVKEW